MHTLHPRQDVALAEQALGRKGRIENSTHLLLQGRALQVILAPHTTLGLPNPVTYLHRDPV